MPQKYSAPLACALIATGIMTTPAARVTAQERAVNRPDLSGRWELNRDLSDDAKEKLDNMRSSQGAGGHGPGRHGGLGGIFGGGQAAHAQVEEIILNAPTRFDLTQDDQQVVLTESNGRVRTLPTNNRKVKVDGRDVKTRWESDRLVSEIATGNATVVEVYERSPEARQLIVTATAEMRGHKVSVRRVYDAVTTF